MLAFFGRLLTSGFRMHAIDFASLLKGLCVAKRTDEAMGVLLHRIPEVGCLLDVISYLILPKGLCDDGRSQTNTTAVQLLRMMSEQGGDCSPNVRSYNAVIKGFFKEGEAAKACDLFNEMVQLGISPTVMTYNLVIDALCKARAIDKVEVVLQKMVDKGLKTNTS